jgi:hypothetical protein
MSRIYIKMLSVLTENKIENETRDCSLVRNLPSNLRSCNVLPLAIRCCDNPKLSNGNDTCDTKFFKHVRKELDEPQIFMGQRLRRKLSLHERVAYLHSLGSFL